MGFSCTDRVLRGDAALLLQIRDPLFSLHDRAFLFHALSIFFRIGDFDACRDERYQTADIAKLELCDLVVRDAERYLADQSSAHEHKFFCRKEKISTGPG